MVVILFHRHHGYSSRIKEAVIPGDFTDYYKGLDNIEEKRLLDNLPASFLPTQPQNVLLTVGGETSSTGQRNLKYFRDYEKYFDAYSIELVDER